MGNKEITILLDEYKELLEIKGRYEEKTQTDNIQQYKHTISYPNYPTTIWC